MIQHSSESAEWYTPNSILDRVRKTFGGEIDFDPCGSEWTQANTVRASNYDDQSTVDLWHESVPHGSSVFVNPPGSCRAYEGFKYGDCSNQKRCSCKLPRSFMQSSLLLSEHSNVIYLAYSVNQLRTLSSLIRGSKNAAYNVEICIPEKRIKYISGETLREASSTPCDSAIILMSTDDILVRRFVEYFHDLGAIFST